MREGITVQWLLCGVGVGGWRGTLEGILQGKTIALLIVGSMHGHAWYSRRMCVYEDGYVMGVCYVWVYSRCVCVVSDILLCNDPNNSHPLGENLKNCFGGILLELWLMFLGCFSGNKFKKKSCADDEDLLSMLKDRRSVFHVKSWIKLCGAVAQQHYDGAKLAGMPCFSPLSLSLSVFSLLSLSLTDGRTTCQKIRSGTSYPQDRQQPNIKENSMH